MRFNIFSLGLIATAFILSISAQPIGNSNQQQIPPPKEEEKDSLIPGGLDGVTEIAKGIPMSGLTSAAGGLDSDGLAGEGLTRGLLGKGGAGDTVHYLFGNKRNLDAAKDTTDTVASPIGGLDGGKFVSSDKLRKSINELTGDQISQIFGKSSPVSKVPDDDLTGFDDLNLSSVAHANLSEVADSLGDVSQGAANLVQNTAGSVKLNRRQTTIPQGSAKVDEKEADENEVTPNEIGADKDEGNEDSSANIVLHFGEAAARRSTVGDIEEQAGIELSVIY